MNNNNDHTKAAPAASTKVIKSSLWGIAANGLQSILLSLFFVILAREYNKGEFATFLIANNIYQLLAAFSTLGLGQWFTRELINSTNARGLTNKFLKMQLYSGVFFYFVNIALAWALYQDVGILKIAVILGVNVVFDNFIYAIRSLNIAEFRQHKTFIILLIDSVFKFIASCILFIYPISILTLSIVLIAFRFITLNLFINYGTSKTVNIYQLIKHKISLAEIKKLVTQNWAFIIIGSVSILYWRIGNTIISKMLTEADVANYEVSYRIFSLALILPMIFSTTVFPQFVSLSKNENKQPLYEYFHKVFQLFVLYSLLAFTFMYSFAGDIIPFVFGQEYSNNVIHSIQMFLAVLVFPTVLLQANMLVALHQEKKDMWLNIIALISNVVLTVVGILYFKSLDGVNLAIFFSFLLFHLLQDFLLLKMGITSFFKIVQFYLIIVVVVGGYALLSKYISPLWLYPSFVMLAGLILLNATVGFRAVAVIFKRNWCNQNNLNSGMKQKVFYYTSAYFFDVSIELIQVLKQQVDLYVFIEVTNASKNATILDIASLPENGSMFTATQILSEHSMKHFHPYFEGVKEVNFVVHNYRSANLWRAYRSLAPVRKMMAHIKPDVLHMEGYTLRTVGLFPLFGSVKKLLLTVHDSQVHSGMKNLKVIVPRLAAFRWPVKKVFVFYSEFSKNDFVKNIAHSKAQYLSLQLYKFTFLEKMSGSKNASSDYILFFGRISAYKGLDLLLNAMVRVWEQYPNEKLVIAGGGADEELLAHPLLRQPHPNIIFHNRFIPAPELSAIISKAKFVLCPYKDATQSGVVVSSFAMNKPVLATNVGAFSEQIQDGVTGMLIPAATESSVADSILYALDKEKYKEWELFLIKESNQNKWAINAKKLVEAYQ